MARLLEEIQAPEAFHSFVEEVLRILGDDPHREGVASQVAQAVRTALQSEEVYSWLCSEGPKHDALYDEGDMGFAILVSSEGGQYREPHDHGPCWAVNGTLGGATRLRHYARDLAASTESRIVLRRVDEVVCGPRQVDCTDIGIAHELIPMEPGPSLAVRCHDVRTVTQHRYDLNKGIFRLLNRSTGESFTTGYFRIAP
jgi:hypothetical protein